MGNAEGAVYGLPLIPVPQHTGDDHGDFHQRSLLPRPSSLCTRCAAALEVES